MRKQAGRKILVLTSAVAITTLVCSFPGVVSEAAEPPDWSSRARLATGLKAMEHPEWVPLFLPDGTETKQTISYDPTGGNDDGLYKNWIRYIDEHKEWVNFDEIGPGCLYRQQMNVWKNGGDPRESIPPKARIKYYFDGETAARVDMTFDQLFGRHQKFTPPLSPPLAFFDDRTMVLGTWVLKDRFAVLYYPFAFQKRLKITMTTPPDGRPNRRWFQYTYLKYPWGTSVPSWKGMDVDSPVVRRQWENLGTDPKSAAGNRRMSKDLRIDNGASATAIELSGQGSIASLRFVLEPYTRETFYKTQIAISWDDQSKPAVTMPLGCFFGGGDPQYVPCKDVWKNPFKSLFQGFDPATKSFYMFWPMPYWSKAKIVLTNRSGTPITSLKVCAGYKPAEVLGYPRGKAGYFHAKQTIEVVPKGAYYSTAFVEKGRGKVVADFLFSQGYDMDGDTFVYFDDSWTPQIHGDGTEDDHNQGWGGDSYQKPLWGGLPNGYAGGYRFYMNDSYIFDKNINLNYELSTCQGKTNFGQKTDAIVYYYKAEDGVCNLRRTDELDVGNPASEKAHGYSVTQPTWAGKLTCSYDVYERNRHHNAATDDGRAFQGFSQFTVKINPDNNGVKLRRRANRNLSYRQLASVSVDGSPSEIPWYICELASSPPETGWVDSDLFIPAALTRGKRQITVKVRCVESANARQGINEFYYWVYGYGPTSDGGDASR